MNKRVGVLFLGAALCLTAQEGQTWASAEIGMAFRKKEPHNFDGLAFGIGAGHWFTDRWGMDLKGLRTQQDQPTTLASSRHENYYLGSLLFNLLPGEAKWSPYLAVGAGASTLEPTATSTKTYANGHFGVGAIAHITKHVVIQFDLKAVHTKVDDKYYHVDMAILSLGYSWGGK